MELDLENITKKENPAMFFKQRDLEYSVGWQSIKIKNTNFEFNHTDRLRVQKSNWTGFQVKESGASKYFAQLPVDLFISDNIENMDSIWILNFFRFIDCLEDTSGEPATKKIESIYNLTGSLNDHELSHFLKEIGRKMSCNAEFNFEGAHKIDLEGLKSITIYEGERALHKVKIDSLCEQLNNNNFELFNILKENNAELFKSSRFVEFLLSKITNLEVKKAIITVQ